MKLFVFVLLFSTLLAGKPELFLLNKYSPNINVSGWYMSEKLDGVRAYWDGKQLISRNGKIFSVPLFFTKDFPNRELDGELWSKHQDFSTVSSIVNRKNADNEWEKLTYNIFEVPHAKGSLLQRLEKVKESKYVHLIKQIKVKDKKHLDAFLDEVERKGGEGIVVRDASLAYYSGRDNNALKVKSFSDAECKIIGYTKGKGKNEGKVGAFLCETASLKVIKIGTGLKDDDRVNPPKINAIITYKYYGLTSKGNPRFPVFLRVRIQ